ncbi:MAG: response regulator [Planctomycetes bacterium]|nr:response regulator [Planctomycetota bacterium]
MTGKTVLLVDDDDALLRGLAQRCQAWGVKVRCAHNAIEAVYELLVGEGQGLPNLVILDVNLPVDDGLSVCELLVQDLALAAVPVIVLMGRSDEATIRRCEQLGAHYVRKSPQMWADLERLACELLESQPAGIPRLGFGLGAEGGQTHDGKAAPRVLCVDDDHQFCRAIECKLRAYGAKVCSVFNGVQGYWAALKQRPDVILSDFQMPGYGYSLLRSLKRHAATKDIPVIILTGRCERALEQEMLREGAAVFLAKPLDDRRLQELRRYVVFSSEAQVRLPPGEWPPRRQQHAIEGTTRVPLADAWRAEERPASVHHGVTATRNLEEEDHDDANI